MGRFDRYMLSQLMVVFGFFSFVLVMVYWINRAVRLFDQLIADGQTAGVFLEFSLLSLPSVMTLALPLAAFISAVYVTNRMSQESELVAIQATGYSSWRLARPVFFFGVLVLLLLSLIAHVLVPLSSLQLKQRTAEISQSTTARLLNPGAFNEPTKGITFYIRDTSDDGELRNIFLSDNRNAERNVIYTAEQAYLINSEGGTQLVMVNGLAQNYDTSLNRLFTTRFDDFALDLGGILTASSTYRRKIRHISSLELLTANVDMHRAMRVTPSAIIREVNIRASQSLLGIIGPLIGFAALLVGGFSRYGVWRQVLLAVFLIIALKAIEATALNIARENDVYWFALYFPAVFGAAAISSLLIISERPTLLNKKPTKAASVRL